MEQEISHKRAKYICEICINFICGRKGEIGKCTKNKIMLAVCVYGETFYYGNVQLCIENFKFLNGKQATQRNTVLGYIINTLPRALINSPFCHKDAEIHCAVHLVALLYDTVQISGRFQAYLSSN